MITPKRVYPVRPDSVVERLFVEPQLALIGSLLAGVAVTWAGFVVITALVARWNAPMFWLVQLAFLAQTVTLARVWRGLRRRPQLIDLNQVDPNRQLAPISWRWLGVEDETRADAEWAAHYGERMRSRPASQNGPATADGSGQPARKVS